MEWGAGDVTGVLPYSRLRKPPGDAIVEDAVELLALDRSRLPDLIRECPEITAILVHAMTDRARQFTASDLHDEKMVSLGTLSAGLAHELNNPLNNIGLYLGNVLDRLDSGRFDEARLRRDLAAALTQVHKATEIISHLRTFGRSAPSVRESVAINEVIHRACSLLQEQFRLRGVELAGRGSRFQLHDDGVPYILPSRAPLRVARFI